MFKGVSWVVGFHNLVMVHWLMWKSYAPCDYVSLWLIMESHVHYVIMFPCDLLWNHMCTMWLCFLVIYYGSHVHHVIMFPCDLLWITCVPCHYVSLWFIMNHMCTMSLCFLVIYCGITWGDHVINYGITWGIMWWINFKKFFY